MFNVTIYDISVIYVTAHRCSGGLKKKFDLRSGSQRHRHFVGSFNVTVLAPTRDHPFYTVIPTQRSRVGSWTGTLKNPTKCLWRWEPDRRFNFLCAVTYITEISLHVTLSKKCIPRKFREDTQDWFGKRGLALYIGVTLRK